MLRSAKLIVVGVLLMVASATEAAAKDWWAWLEEFSGPGDFGSLDRNTAERWLSPFGLNSRPPLSLCFAPATSSPTTLSGGPLDPSLFWIRADRLKRLSINARSDSEHCIFYDNRRYLSPPSASVPDEGPVVRYGDVEARTDEVGYSFLHKSHIFEVGAGFGRINFLADGQPTEGKWLVTPARLVVRPLYIIPQLQKHRVLGVFKVWMKIHYVAGELTGTTFGLSDPDAFRERNEWLRSNGFLVDAIELVCLIDGLCNGQ